MAYPAKEISRAKVQKFLENRRVVEDDAAAIARMIVETHANDWGPVPGPEFLQAAIAAALHKTVRRETLTWVRDASK